MDKKIDLLIHFFNLQTKNQKLGYSIFQNKQLIFSNSAFQESICKVLPKFQYASEESKLDFLITEDYFLYGYISSEEALEIIIGPGTVGIFNPTELEELQNKINTTTQLLEQQVLPAAAKLENTSLEFFLHAICAAECFVNQKIVQPQALVTSPSEDDSLLIQIQSKLNEFEQENQYNNEHTNTVNYEEKIAYCIRQGDLEALKQILDSFSHTLNRLGPDALRHSKNAAIILNSLALRAAIAGGVDSDICYRLGGIYISNIEASSSIQELNVLSSTMVKDYCQRVKTVQPLQNQLDTIEDEEINRCINYISDHFREKLSVGDIAEYIGYSPEYLSTKFKKVTGKNLPQFINEKRVNEAQRQLALSDRPISDISEQLSFSSQSYFQKIFKQIVGMTPLKYRQTNNFTSKK
ncbi:hypothetical protein BAU15_00020 [Enterococcus sp. JM4C]|uniref:helix-turn-helix transcriptional regulator n=1 Tax=Candidatus Enterococcus huntleyi TaxID=1857217 RepID=UPI001379B3F2|nr:AraC family transcriptional regulator [Enterococcus sp. JM4C]KAF1299067.1 hypothetical protein BAU15_00020 [Enterococcus sp. JM4C]